MVGTRGTAEDLLGRRVQPLASTAEATEIAAAIRAAKRGEVHLDPWLVKLIVAAWALLCLCRGC